MDIEYKLQNMTLTNNANEDGKPEDAQVLREKEEYLRKLEKEVQQKQDDIQQLDKRFQDMCKKFWEQYVQPSHKQPPHTEQQPGTTQTQKSNSKQLHTANKARRSRGGKEKRKAYYRRHVLPYERNMQKVANFIVHTALSAANGHIPNNRDEEESNMEVEEVTSSDESE